MRLILDKQVGGGGDRMPAGASPEPLGTLPMTVPMWEHDGFGRVGSMAATPFGLPASAFYAASLQVLLIVSGFQPCSMHVLLISMSTNFCVR